MSVAPSRPPFPWWIPIGAVAAALVFLPTLGAPFDFIDDGNLVYPAAPGTPLYEHPRLWWEAVVANVEHLGPFRPTLWAHWHVQANVFGADPVAWRAYRLLWCALAAGLLLWLLRELNVPAAAALFATGAAIANPYRSEIWTSLTLSEAVAMPYALFALVAARRAARSPRPARWDVAGACAVLVALGCKNTFAALVPAQMVLRVLADGEPLAAASRAHGRRAAALALTLALPAAHFVYFKLNWHPGQYEPCAPTAAQALRVLRAIKGGMGLDFLGAGVALAVVVASRAGAVLREHRAGAAAGAVLAAAGAAVYLPMADMSGRYTMPAVWGLDVLFALLLTALLRSPPGWPRRVAVAALCAGLVATVGATVVRQQKAAARANLLWQVVHHIEATAPPGAAVVWVTGDPPGGLGVEEGVHVEWHLAGRGRPDIRVALHAADGTPLARVEVPGSGTAPPVFRVSADPTPPPGWEPDRTVSEVYQFGRKRYDYSIARRPAP